MSEDHGHEGHSIWQEFWEVATDPAHILTELVYNFAWDVVFLLLFVPLFLKWKKRFTERLHHEIDREHGITHDHETGHDVE